MELQIELFKNMSVLYAEDDELLRESTTKTLEFFFNTVYSVKDGNEALGIYNNKKPDILIFDIKMPYIDGLELSSIIRKSDSIIPIIITTCYSETEDLLEAIKLNLIEYIIKPYNFEQLRQALLQCLERLDKYGLLLITLKNNTIYDYCNKIVIQEGQKISLTKNEMLIFEYLIRNRSKLLTYDLIESFLEKDTSVTRVGIKNTVSRLRKKIGKNAIINIYEMGYMVP